MNSGEFAFVPADAVSVFCFLALMAVILAAFVAGGYFAAGREGRPAVRFAARIGAGIVGWVGLVSVVVGSGALAERPMPGIPLLFGAVNLVALLFALSPAGRVLARGLPIPALVAFQAFRLPLELILHAWAQQRTIPQTMTWTGQNYDILSGIAALVLAPWAAKSRAAAWMANGLGFALLLNVGRVAMMSSPLPFAWGTEPPLLLALHLPYAWIAPLAVGGALAGHVILTRALLKK